MEVRWSGNTPTSETFRPLVEQHFVLTGDPNDWVVTEDLLRVLRSQTHLSGYAISCLLTQMGVGVKRQRLGKTVLAVRTGLKPQPS